MSKNQEKSKFTFHEKVEFSLKLARYCVAEFGSLGTRSWWFSYFMKRSDDELIRIAKEILK